MLRRMLIITIGGMVMFAGAVTAAEVPINPITPDVQDKIKKSVRLVSDADGNPSDKVYNLMDRDASGAFTHSILKLYQQEEVNLELDEYLAVV